MTDNRTTELLHKLLDERGVEYFTDDDERAYDEPARTTWDFVLCGLEMTVTATEFVDVEGKTYLEMDFHHAFTPEQAVAATLGSSALTADDVLNAVYKHGARWQAIADELNAELGSGTCENKAKSWGEFECSECEFCADFGSDLHRVRLCPDCGRTVRA